MKLRLLSLRSGEDGSVEAIFGSTRSEEAVLDVFHMTELEGRLAVTGSERDVLNLCNGTAEDVRRVIRAVVAFAEANDPARFPD